MIIRVTVLVQVDPAEIDGPPQKVLEDEILSNLESLDYVTAATLEERHE